MSNRPAPRASSLAGMTPSRPTEARHAPVQPATAPDAPSTPSARPEPAEPRPAASETDQRAQPAPTAEQGPSGKAGEEAKKKDGFYITPSDKKRAVRAQKAASLFVGDTEINSWTAYVEYAVMKLTKDLERRYNDSRPF